MSLRSEYSYFYVFNQSTMEYDVTVYHQPPRHKVASDSILHRDDVDALADRLIYAHMEKVTRMLEGGPIDPDKAEESDRLAHKADHDNQCGRDLEP